jgi:hypothetical protein
MGAGAAAGREPDEVRGQDEDGVASHSPAATHNDVSGGSIGSVQAGSIGGNVVIAAGTPTQRRWWGAGGSANCGSGVDEWAEGLAQGVQTLWRREEAHRRVHDPVALPVRFHPASAEVADHWTNVRRLPAGAIAEPLVLAGRIEHLAELYRSVPSGRLVILGPAGAGKTVLASRLALDLLAARRPGEPVPVIVSAGSWNPATTPLNTWLAGQLARDLPGLAAPSQRGGPTRAAAVLAAGRVLPILDGFDEIDPGLHQAAFRQLNTTPDTPLVMTSRVVEYTAAVRGADVLTAAAVVELDQLTLEDLAAYLPRTAAGHRSALWDPVLDRMRAEPNLPGPARLRGVLSNPLMVFLARTIYSDTPGHDPVELLDTHQFPTAQALQDHLLAAFIPAAYQADYSGSTRRQWTVDRARRYLTYLAGHLHHAGTRDLAWWQLIDTIPRWPRALIFAVARGLVTAYVFVFVLGLPVGLVLGPGIAITIMTGSRELYDAGPQPKGRARFISRRFVTTLAVGLVSAPLIGLVFGFAVGVAVGLVFGLAVATAIAVAFGPEVPADAAEVVSAEESLAWDRRNTIRTMLTFMFVLGLAAGLMFGLTAGMTVGFAALVGVGFLTGSAGNAWIYWLVLVRGWLPLTGRLPWRVQAFLTDAYQRGVLRQTGAVYQFRHARLQDQLTAEPPAADR